MNRRFAFIKFWHANYDVRVCLWRLHAFVEDNKFYVRLKGGAISKCFMIFNAQNAFRLIFDDGSNKIRIIDVSYLKQENYESYIEVFKIKRIVEL